MKILGHFKYHSYEVKLEGNDDETEYKITLTTTSLRRRTGTTPEPEIETHLFKELSPAKSMFEDSVFKIINQYSSLSDVSLYEQLG